MHAIDYPSPNFEPRTSAIDLVVLHYTGMQNAEVALRRLTDAAPVAGGYPGPWQDPNSDPGASLARVSAHYVVGEQGEIWRLVAEDQRAWHAGQAFWDGDADVNSRSIGVEIVNGGHDFGLPDFADAQIEAVIVLLRDVLARYGLAPDRVVGHSDVAPGRKLDPGEKFHWKRLASAGVSVWPRDAPAEIGAAMGITQIQQGLIAFGYGVDQSGVLDDRTRLALISFQRRFRPQRIDGKPDAETLRLLAALTNS